MRQTVEEFNVSKLELSVQEWESTKKNEIACPLLGYYNPKSLVLRGSLSGMMDSGQVSKDCLAGETQSKHANAVKCTNHKENKQKVELACSFLGLVVVATSVVILAGADISMIYIDCNFYLWIPYFISLKFLF